MGKKMLYVVLFFYFVFPATKEFFLIVNKKMCATLAIKNAIMKNCCLYERGVLFIIAGRTKQATKCFSLQYEFYFMNIHCQYSRQDTTSGT